MHLIHKALRAQFSLLLSAALVLALAACNAAPAAVPTSAPVAARTLEPTAASDTEAASQQDDENSCAFRAIEITPTPVMQRPTPPPPPPPTPVDATPTPEPLELPVYPDLPAPRLPEPVEAWQDAVVTVRVHYATGEERVQNGLIVDPAGKALTVLSLLDEVDGIVVEIPGQGIVGASISALDARTGAAVLDLEADGLVAAPVETASAAPGQPVLLLSRSEDEDSLQVAESFASPSVNAPDDLIALLIRFAPYQSMGTVIVSREGTPIGLAGGGRAWFGRQFISGPVPGPDQPAVLLGSAMRLLDGAASQSGAIPAAVAYHGQGWGMFIDGPLTREMVAQPVQEALNDLGERVLLEDLGRRAYHIVSASPANYLELVYAQPQELRNANGKLLGSGRYIVLWWNRGGGLPDIVLCGTETEYLGAAFTADGLKDMETTLEQAPHSTRSIVDGVRLPVSDEDWNTYPYSVSLTPDRAEYAPGEPVTLTVTVTNISGWPMPLNQTPPMIDISHSQGFQRRIAVIPYGSEGLTLEPNDTASFTVTWDQFDYKGQQAPPGTYIAYASIANLEKRRFFSGDTEAQVILLPEGGALLKSIAPGQSASDADVTVTLRQVEFGPGEARLIAYAASDDLSSDVPGSGRNDASSNNSLVATPTPSRILHLPGKRSVYGPDFQGYVSIDGGPAQPIQNPGIRYEDGDLRMEWKLPPVPSDAGQLTIVFERIDHIDGRWEFVLNLGDSKATDMAE